MLRDGGTAMSDQLADSAERLFAAHSGKDVHPKLAEGGDLPAGAVGCRGGRGLHRRPAAGRCRRLRRHRVPRRCACCSAAAAHAAPIPLAETMLAGWLLAKAGLPVPAGPLTLAPVRRGDGLALRRRPRGGHGAGACRGRRDARAIVVLPRTGGRGAASPAGGFRVTPGANLAGEPRDTLVFDAAVTATPWRPSTSAARARRGRRPAHARRSPGR